LPFIAIVGYTTFAVLFGLLVNEGINGNNKVINFIFNNRLLKFFGQISYSLYVFHWPLHLLTFPIILNWLSLYISNFDFLQIISAIITTVAGIGLSIISYYYFELPFLRLKKRVS
jgi:peptidoglycan/LPS O-acetylase OafA/YrhL